MPDELESAVIILVADECGVKPEHLTPNTRILHDLGCDGQDAADLLRRFAQAFGVDASAFRFQQHFGPEAAFNPVLYLYYRLFRPEKLRSVPLTVGDLTEMRYPLLGSGFGALTAGFIMLALGRQRNRSGG